VGGTGNVRRVAVLPFENLGSPENEYFADGIVEDIMRAMCAVYAEHPDYNPAWT